VARKGNKGNKDGRDAVAIEIIKANLELSNAKISKVLQSAGTVRGQNWVSKRRYALAQENGGLMA
jgi:hypothetical protein